MPTYDATVRASRLIRILLLLQTRGSATAEELADELEVSVRTVYRDLADLGAAGVPVYGERGEGGGYRLVGGYRTHLTGLTADEAEALLLGGAAAPVTGELGIGGLLASARLKLLAAIPPGMRGVAVRAEQRFHLDPGGWAHAPRRSIEHVEALSGAVWEDRVIVVRYRRGGADAAVRRTLHPLGLVHKTGTWYLVAAHRGRPRVYRADRIVAVTTTDRGADRPDGFELATFWTAWEQEYADRLPTLAVDVRLGPEAQRHRDALGALAPREVHDERADDGGWTRQTLVFDSAGVARAALLALAPDVEVRAPASLRGELAAAARDVVGRNA